MATQGDPSYYHLINLGPYARSDGYSKVSLNQVITISAISVDGELFWAYICNPYDEIVYSSGWVASLSISYTAQITGNYRVQLYNPVSNYYDQDVTIAYTITCGGIDIVLPGSFY